MERLTFRISDRWIDTIDDAVESGRFPNRSEALRHAVRAEFGPIEGDRLDIRDKLNTPEWGEVDV